MNQVDLLLETLNKQQCVSKDSREALNDPKVKSEVSQYLISILNSSSSNILSTNVNPDTALSTSNSIVEQIAELSNDSQTIQRQNKALLQSNWDEILQSFDVLAKSVDNLSQLAVASSKLTANKLSVSKSDTQPLFTESNLIVLLNNIDTLIAILELPSLTCSLVKMTKYSECIEVSSLTKRLAIRYSNFGLISDIEDNVAREIEGMVQSLIRLVNTNIKQSTIIKIMSLLKRITNNGDLLEQIYLKSRHQFIMQELDSLLPLLESHFVERYLKRSIEVVREHCFQTIMTFESLFAANASLCSSFVSSIVDHLCTLLQHNLDDINDVSIRDSLLLQLVYCSQSLTRRGADFTTLVAHRLQLQIPADQFWSIVARQRELVKSFSF